MKFLGGWLQSTGKQHVDTKNRIASAQMVWNELAKQLNKLNSDKLLGHLLQAIIHGCLLYGVESRFVSSKQCQQFPAFQNNKK